jgi:protein-S-isoprenylcysteine O-methyltransferase Ste14
MTATHQARVLLVMTAQVVLSAIFIGGYFVLMYQFMVGNVHVPETFKDAFLTLLGVLTAGVGLILSFWFQRQREQTPPQAGQ